MSTKCHRNVTWKVLIQILSKYVISSNILVAMVNIALNLSNFGKYSQKLGA